MTIEMVVIVVLAVIATGGALFAIRVTFNRRTDRSNRVTLRNINTTGDVAGRDINNNTKT